MHPLLYYSDAHMSSDFIKKTIITSSVIFNSLVNKTSLPI